MALDWLLRPILLNLFIIFIVQSSLTSSISESEALLQLKKSFTNANALTSWVSGSVPCKRDNQWNGLLCFNGIVTGLRLENMGLSGKIDVDALANIPGLRSVSFNYNSFSGTIPELNRIGYLKAIYLRGNQFSGQIPSDFFSKMESLKKVWLSHNMFNGEIPSSLTQLSHLTELHLENNQFSGIIPTIKQPTLMSFNVSNNKLEGEIPPSLARFNMSSFEGNADLCHENSGKQCQSTIDGSFDSPNIIGSNNANAASTGRDHNRAKKAIAGIITLTGLLLCVVLVVVIRKKRKKEDFDTLRKGRTDNESSEVQVSVSNRSKDTELSKKVGSSRKGSSHGKGGVGELVMVNDEIGVFGLPDLMKAAAEVIGNGGLGSSYKAVMTNGMAVVVKRIRDMNALGKNGFDAEIRKLGKLRHTNILTPLAFHYRREENLLIYEYIPKGSLLYLLHGDRGPSHAELDWPARLKIVQGIAKGLGYLHTELASSNLPHGNLKSSNVLLSPNNEPLLSEFGFSPLMNPSVAAQALFAYKAPEAVQYGVSPKCDVYCLGIIILEILTGKFPSQYLSNSKGGIDVVQWVKSAISEGKESELLDPEIASSSNSVGQTKQLLHIGAACAEGNPVQRLDMREAIQMIDEIQLEGDCNEARAMHMLPSLRDGYADAPRIKMSGSQGNGEYPRRGHGSDSFTDGTGHLDGDHFSFAIS